MADGRVVKVNIWGGGGAITIHACECMRNTCFPAGNIKPAVCRALRGLKAEGKNKKKGSESSPKKVFNLV